MTTGPVLTPALTGKPAAFRVAMLLGFILCLQIPVLINFALVSERRGRRDAAVVEVASKWGQQQTIVGPALVVPWTHRWVESDGKGGQVQREEPRRLVILPDSLDLTGKVTTESRSRGIYRIPVYRLDALLSGRFKRPDLSKLGVDSSTVDWSRASLGLGISDPRAIEQQVTMSWQGRPVDFMPGVGDFVEAASGIHAELGSAAPVWDDRFSIPVRLKGTRSIQLTPFGKTTYARLSGTWPSPSFQGLWLPNERNVAGSGFTAVWEIPDLGRNFASAWTDAMGPREQIQQSTFGLDLFSDVDTYRMCERTTKYAALFFILTFVSFWLLEVLGGRAIHPIQYALVGATLCIFMLLELSLSEHIGFGWSYLIASAAVVGLIVVYAASALGNAKRAGLVGLGLGMLYLFHYFVLRNEDYALLMGSLLLFGTLATVMVVTRRIDWYGAKH